MGDLGKRRDLVGTIDGAGLARLRDRQRRRRSSDAGCGRHSGRARLATSAARFCRRRQAGRQASTRRRNLRRRRIRRWRCGIRRGRTRRPRAGDTARAPAHWPRSRSAPETPRPRARKFRPCAVRAARSNRHCHSRARSPHWPAAMASRMAGAIGAVLSLAKFIVPNLSGIAPYAMLCSSRNPWQIRRNRAAISHCAPRHPMIHSAARERAQGNSLRRERGRTLVLASGICHVLHRTALLSQFVAQSASGEGVSRVAAEWRGRRRTAATSSRSAASGTKVASKMSGSPSGAALPFLPRIAGTEERVARGGVRRIPTRRVPGLRRGVRVR